MPITPAATRISFANSAGDRRSGWHRLAALAEQDLEQIWSYVAKDASPTIADGLVDAIIT